MRMTSEEFHTWSQRLQFPSETEALIASIRSSPPVRRVSGRANNITGRYPSPKMRVSIQFESDRVEFWAIYGMERDNDVLEFYDSPPPPSLFWGGGCSLAQQTDEEESV